jgi:hypothetical protein
MHFAPTSRIGRPGLREIEPGRHGPVHRGPACRLIGDIVGRDDDLTIGDLAQCAGILAGDADRAAALLGQAGVVQDQEAVGRALRHQGPHALRIHGLGLPGRVGQEML